MKDKLICKTDDYKVYKDKDFYYIIFKNHTYPNPYPSYKTLAGIKERLYYEGYLNSKIEKLPKED